MIKINETNMKSMDIHIAAGKNKFVLNDNTEDVIDMVSLELFIRDDRGYSTYKNIISIIKDPNGEDNEMVNLWIPVNLTNDLPGLLPGLRFDVVMDWDQSILIITSECGMMLRITLYSNNHKKYIRVRDDMYYPKKTAYIPNSEYLRLSNGVEIMENIIRNNNAYGSTVREERIKLVNGLNSIFSQPQPDVPENEYMPLQPISSDNYKMMLSAFSYLYTECVKADSTSIFSIQDIVQSYIKYVVDNFQKLDDVQ